LPPRRGSRLALESLEDRCVPSTVPGFSSIQADFNGAPIGSGSTLWFNSVLQTHNLGNGPVTLDFTNQAISFTANGTNYNVKVPNSAVTFSASTTVASTTFDASTNSWTTALPMHFGGNAFLGGAALVVPNDLPGNIKSVTWQGQMQSDTPNVQVQWQWGAADYTSFATDYSTLNIKPVDDDHVSNYQNHDHAGTPEAFKAYVTGGGTGDGHGQNYTGNGSPNAHLTPPQPSSASGNVTYTSGNSSDYPFLSSNPLTSVAFNESDVLAGAAMDATHGTFEVWYTDEHAMTLGVNQVTVKAANGTTTTTNYPVTAMTSDPGVALNPAVGTTASSGDQAGTDPAGRPLAPTLYITDITNNPTACSGDWQYGGTGLAPNAVFGAWKSYTRTVDYTRSPADATLTGANDPAPNQQNLGTGSDALPAGLRTESYTAEVRWNLNDLYSQGVLIPGRNYRFYVMVHDGDQNKSGGDVGQASYSLIYPGPPANFLPPPASLSGFVYNGTQGGVMARVQLNLSELINGQLVVVATTTTATDGSYRFQNLQPGTYQVTETQPPMPSGFTSESTNPSVGTVNGTSDGSGSSVQIGGIVLGSGNSGINYNFTNFFAGSGGGFAGS
jgi:hypothetical protein